jgi:bisphosphoglycerate-dependent phosphoglycerate mutase
MIIIAKETRHAAPLHRRRRKAEPRGETKQNKTKRATPKKYAEERREMHVAPSPSSQKKKQQEKKKKKNTQGNQLKTKKYKKKNDFGER